MNWVMELVNRRNWSKRVLMCVVGKGLILRLDIRKFLSCGFARPDKNQKVLLALKVKVK